jgi:hypothetical protein
LKGDLQNCEFAGLEREHWEQEKANDEADSSAKIACEEYEHPIPPAYCKERDQPCRKLKEKKKEV